MKISWGTGIVIAFVLFIGFILFFVISMTTQKKYQYDLVTEKYYQKELVFQKRIDAEKNAKQLKQNISVRKIPEGLEIIFPEEFNPKKIKGTIFLYRPSNKQLDFEIPISISKSYLLMPDKRLLGGRWNIEINWQYNSTPYFFEKEIIY